LVDSATPGGISFVSPGNASLGVDGYCLILNNETDNGSPVGVQLVPSWNHANSDGGVPIIQSAFTPAANVTHRLTIARATTGVWELFVDDVSVGTALDLSTSSFDAVSIVAGADGNVGAGGSFDDLELNSCAN